MKNNTTTVQKIAKYIRQEITYSNFKSGQHIKESDIAKKFNVSRVPVREAFRILQSEGYLEVIPHRGSFVQKLTRDNIIEIGIVYKLLAPVVLDKAIPRYKDTTYCKADVILHKISICDDFNQAGYLLWDFAKLIYSPSRLKFMISLFDEIYSHNIRALNEIFEIKQHHTYDLRPHRKFLDLCKKNKKEEAIEVWCDHIEKIKNMMLNSH